MLARLLFPAEHVLLHQVIAGPLGLVVGLVLGLTGAGGAVLSVPLLTLVLQMPMVEAAPIGLLAVTLSSGVGAAIALRRGILRYRAALLMALAGAMATPLGVSVAHRLPNRPLSAVFSLLLFWIAARTWQQTLASRTSLAEQRRERPPPCRLDKSAGRLIWTLPCARLLAGYGVLAGFLSGLLGVGGGFILVPALRKHTDLEMNWVIATSMGVLTLISGLGTAVSALHAPLNLGVGLPFIGGAVAGMMIGRHWSTWLSGRILQRGFAVMAFAAAISMGVQAGLAAQ
jgi:uncharacterized membrane protein YfcA